MVSDCQQYSKLHVYLWAVCVLADDHRWQTCLLCLALVSSQPVSLVLYVHAGFKGLIPARHLQEPKQQQAVCKVADSGKMRGRIRNRNTGENHILSGNTGVTQDNLSFLKQMNSRIVYNCCHACVCVIVLKHCANTSGGACWKNKRSFQCDVICHL